MACRQDHVVGPAARINGGTSESRVFRVLESGAADGTGRSSGRVGRESRRRRGEQQEEEGGGVVVSPPGLFPRERIGTRPCGASTELSSREKHARRNKQGEGAGTVTCWPVVGKIQPQSRQPIQNRNLCGFW